MADIQADIREFFRYSHQAAKDLVAMGARTERWESDTGTQMEGWGLESGDLRRTEDIDLRRNPIYMGGSWGDWEIFLGTDGVIYKHRFSGSEEYVNGQIVTTLTHRLEKMTVPDLMGRGARFSGMRRHIDKLIGDMYEQ